MHLFIAYSLDLGVYTRTQTPKNKNLNAILTLTETAYAWYASVISQNTCHDIDNQMLQYRIY
jgi:hypothetical protein